MSQPPENQQQYGSILTILGENAEQNGKLKNKQITFTHIAIGDANDQYVQPDRKQTALVNELARIPVNSVDVLQPTPDSTPMLKVEAILPDDVNDLIIREFAAVATFDGNTYFHAVGNCARIYVPAPVNNGNVSTPVTLEMIFVITSAEPIVEIDPNVVTASRAFVYGQVDESDDRLSKTVIDQNGKDWFIEHGFLVTQNGEGGTGYEVMPGIGYVSGYRVISTDHEMIAVPDTPSFVYVDAWRTPVKNKAAETRYQLVVSNDVLDDYTDGSGISHFVCQIAQVMDDGTVIDLRPESERRLRERVAGKPWVEGEYAEPFETRVFASGDRPAVQVYAEQRVLMGNAPVLVSEGGEFWTEEIRRYRDEVDVRGWGVVCNGLVDDTAALRFVLDQFRGTDYLVVLRGKIRVTGTIDFSKCNILSKGARILKDFDGLGVLVDGDVVYTNIEGNLYVDGHGDHKATGQEASENPDAHGVQISGRCYVKGNIYSRFHQGEGFWLNNYGRNMNKCTLESLWSLWCNGYGHRFSGTRDDCSVWKIRTYSQYCFKGGQYVDDDFAGRQWQWFCYNESTTNVDALYGVYLGGLTSSKIHIYSEEQTAKSADAIHIPVTAGYNKVEDARNYRTVNLSPTTVVTYGGIKQYYGDSGNEVDHEFCANLTENELKTVVKTTYGPGFRAIAKEIINGIGGWKKRAQNAAGDIFSAIGVQGDKTVAEGHNPTGMNSLEIHSSKGTPDAPQPLSPGDEFSRLYGRLYTGLPKLSGGWLIKGLVDAIESKMPKVSMVFGVANGADYAVDRMTLLPTGVLNVPAGITPFTGMHLARSVEKLTVGYAVDIHDVLTEQMKLMGESQETGERFVCGSYEAKIPVVRHSQTAMSKVCGGVVESCHPREDGSFDVVIAAVGDNSTTSLQGFLVCDEGGDIAAGDLLCTSSMEGYLMKCQEGAGDNVVKFRAMQNANFVEGKGRVYGYFA